MPERETGQRQRRTGRRELLINEEIYGKGSFFLLSFCCFYLLTTVRQGMLKPLYFPSFRLYLDSGEMTMLIRLIFLLNFGLFCLAGYGKRSLLNLFQVVLFPFLVCGMLRSLSADPGVAGTVLAAAAVLCLPPCVSLTANLLCLTWKKGCGGGHFGKRRHFLLRRCMGGGRGALTVWLLVSCLLMGTVSWSGGAGFERMPETWETQCLWSHNQDRLFLLDGDNFALLTEAEKLQALQEIVELEMIGFGIDKVKLSVIPMENVNEAGYYDVGASAIVISERLLGEDVDVALCLDTVLHECYHAYELSCILEPERRSFERDPWMYERVLLWQEDLQSYQTVGPAPSWEEYMAYYGQSVEEDARVYAAERGADYRAYISLLTAGGEHMEKPCRNHVR